MSDERWSYRGKWALVTGASAGIGEAFARELAARGMNLALAARRETRLRTLAAELGTAHRVRTLVCPADLGVSGAAPRLWREVTEGRAMDLVVNNAGFGLKGGFAELPLERQGEMVQVNCLALMELCHLALGHLRGRRGAIINLASVAGFQPIPGMATYAASKAFVVSLSQALAAECEGTEVRVVTVNPGPVQTEFQAVAGTQVRNDAPGLRTPEQIVLAALAAVEGGSSTVTPGLVNQLSTWAVRVAPRGLVVRAAKAVMTKMR
jgi:short-subunit dehydrogenase